MNTQTSYRRIFALILIPVLFFAFSFSPTMAKGKAPKLSTKTIVLKAKKSKTIKVTGTTKRVKWKVIGNKLVTITAKGKKKHKVVIKAKNKAGKCSVQARVGKKTLKCKVTVKLSGKVSKDKFVNAFDDTAFRLLKDVAKTSKGNILINFGERMLVQLLGFFRKGFRFLLQKAKPFLHGFLIRTSDVKRYGIVFRACVNTYQFPDILWLIQSKGFYKFLFCRSSQRCRISRKNTVRWIQRRPLGKSLQHRWVNLDHILATCGPDSIWIQLDIG